MELPDWFLLMHKWSSSGLGERGVTLAFLVGALAIKNNKLDSTPADARILLKRMTEESVDGFITEVGWCSDLGAPVF